ncbi:ABC-2 type transport system permease protein [Allocatelliglobosispora scoriae]|uniref:Transport permease protein n=1 Tax=Allocatelliglobosispora scoriae TaxID=643052 RepID=A0A841C2U5_9ACTN|nr:ABC transporter permease [Allocatelliglobosispora scoriae]MBB5874088.1 ABC-2 type transport system permease protein [Allocatelliglobosispora scoriae]
MTALHPAPPVSPAASAWLAFRAILWRDVFVTGKEFWVLLIQVAIAPLFMLFIFAKVLGSMQVVAGDYGHTLLPGIVALSTFLAALQSVALPLVMEFGFTKEIEDRLLAPLPTSLVAVEKLVVAMLRGMVSAAIIYPVGALIIGTAPWHPQGLPLLIAMLVLGSWAGGGVGMTIGTFVPPHRINIMFGLIITPIMFTGAVQYPWSSLDSMRWFQVITSLNPLTYCAEGVRAAMVPEIVHLPPAVAAAALVGFSLLFSALGILGFNRRALS